LIVGGTAFLLSGLVFLLPQRATKIRTQKASGALRHGIDEQVHPSLAVRYRQQFTDTVDEIKARLEVSANSKAKSAMQAAGLFDRQRKCLWLPRPMHLVWQIAGANEHPGPPKSFSAQCR
jgi:hypothetical protein